MVKIKKIPIIFMFLVIIVACWWYNFGFNNHDEIYLADKVRIININKEILELNAVETQELADSMGLPLIKDNRGRVKTPFDNEIKFYIGNRCVYWMYAGMPEIFDTDGQVIMYRKPYRISSSFYKTLEKLAEKHGFSLKIF